MRLALVLLAVGVILPAQTRSRKAHEHGSAKVSIAFETAKGAPKGVIEFESPAESVVGFEYEAKTPADKAKVTATDIVADNGVIHVIDSVIMPK